MFLFTVGHYMLLNLFLAILLKFISQNEDSENCCDDHVVSDKDENLPSNQSNMEDELD